VSPLVKHHAIGIVLDVAMVCDDSNLLYSDISRGNELKRNSFASTKLGEKMTNFMLITEC
jgi:hypothetical protein